MKFQPKNWFENCKISQVPEKQFFGRHFLGAPITEVKCTFSNLVKKTDVLMPHLTYSKKKSFYIIEESMCTSYELKSPKCKQPLNILQNGFFFKQRLDFHRPSKILFQTLGVKITGPYCEGRGNSWPTQAHICRTILMKVTYMRRIALQIAFYIPYIFFYGSLLACIFSSIYGSQSIIHMHVHCTTL